ncbi:MAG: hypothetical protein IJO03_02810 [Clostridia bacterium]|nr:hypothetical protein [Clostridia bacterium]
MKKNKISLIVAGVVAFVAIAAAAGIGASFLFNDKEEKSGVSAVAVDFVEDTFLLERTAQHPERYTENLINEYEMSEKKAQEFYECPEEWLVYGQSLTVYNNSADSIRVYGFEVDNNGKGGVYISTSTGGELDIAPGGYGPASFSVFCENGDLSTDEAKELVSDFKIKVLYTKTPAEFDDGTESVEETQKVALEFAE